MAILIVLFVASKIIVRYAYQLIKVDNKYVLIYLFLSINLQQHALWSPIPAVMNAFRMWRVFGVEQLNNVLTTQWGLSCPLTACVLCQKPDGDSAGWTSRHWSSPCQWLLGWSSSAYWSAVSAAANVKGLGTRKKMQKWSGKLVQEKAANRRGRRRCGWDMMK